MLHHNQSTALSKHAQEQTHQATQRHSQGNVEGEGNTHICTTTKKTTDVTCVTHGRNDSIPNDLHTPSEEKICQRSQFSFIHSFPLNNSNVSLFSFIPFP